MNDQLAPQCRGFRGRETDVSRRPEAGWLEAPCEARTQQYFQRHRTEDGFGLRDGVFPMILETMEGLIKRRDFIQSELSAVKG